MVSLSSVGYQSSAKSDKWIHQAANAIKLQYRVGQDCADYPEPIGDPQQLAREARSLLKIWIESHDLKPEAQRI